MSKRGPPKIPKDDLRDELYRLRDELGRIPTSPDMNDHGEYSHMPYVYRWGSWNAALKDVGFEVYYEESTPEELIRDYRRVADLTGKLPSRAILDKYGKWASTTYIDNLGGMDFMATEYLNVPPPPPDDIEPPSLE